MRARHVALLVSVVLFAPLSSFGPASAGPADDMLTNPFIHQTGPTTVDIGIEQTGTAVRVTRSGPSGVAACTYDVLAGEAARQQLLVFVGLDLGEVDPAMRYVFRVCRNGPSFVDLVATYRTGDPITPRLIDALVISAYDRLEIPVLAQQSAPRGDTAAPFIANLATWFWVPAVSWTAVRSDAAIPGARVIATATPVLTQWFPGTGDAPISCTDGGRVYDFAQPDRTQSTGCSFTYTVSSAAQPHASFVTQLTVTWSVSWVCEPACGAGDLPAFEITSSRLVRVAEVQVLNTRSN